MDDALFSLQVANIPCEGVVETVVLNNAQLGSRKGVNLPKISVDLPAVSEKDYEDLVFGVAKV